MTTHSVYVIRAKDDTCLYVGCSANVTARMYDHRRKPWGPLIDRVDVIECETKGQALTVENALIHDLQPLHNIRKRQLHPLLAMSRAAKERRA